SATRSTPRAPAICSSPPGRGATMSASRSTTRSSGRRSTPRCPFASQLAPEAPLDSVNSWKKGPAVVSPRRPLAAHASPDPASSMGMKGLWLIVAAFVAGCGGSARKPDPPPTTNASAKAPDADAPALCRNATVQEVGQVTAPAATELSGLALAPDGLLWTHND